MCCRWSAPCAGPKPQASPPLRPLPPLPRRPGVLQGMDSLRLRTSCWPPITPASAAYLDAPVVHLLILLIALDVGRVVVHIRVLRRRLVEARLGGAAAHGGGVYRVSGPAQEAGGGRREQRRRRRWEVSEDRPRHWRLLQMLPGGWWERCRNAFVLLLQRCCTTYCAPLATPFAANPTPRVHRQRTS